MKKRIILPCLLLGGLWLSSISCSKKNNDVTAPVITADTIYITGSAFSPNTKNIGLGNNVTWINNDPIVHKVVANDGSFNSGDIIKDGSYTHKFNILGSHNYFCQYHTAETGVIFVSTR